MNGILRYHEQAPPRAFADIVESLGVAHAEGDVPSRHYRLLPEVRGKIVLRISGAVGLRIGGLSVSLPSLACFPPGASSLDLLTDGPFTLAVIRFHPWVNWGHGGWPGQVPLRRGRGENARPSLYRFLGDGPKSDERATEAILQVARAVSPGVSLDEVLRAVWPSLATEETGETVETLAEGTGISPRTLLRRCRQTLGMTVKGAIQMERFAKAMRRLRAEPMSWARLAAVTGYYDQSHLAFTFRRFAGMSQTRFFRQGHHHLSAVFARRESKARTEPGALLASGTPALRAPT